MFLKSKATDTVPVFVIKTIGDFCIFSLIMLATHFAMKRLGLGRSNWGNWDDYALLLGALLIGCVSARYLQRVTANDPGYGKPIRASRPLDDDTKA